MPVRNDFNQAVQFILIIFLVVLAWGVAGAMFQYLTPLNLLAGCGSLFLVPVVLLALANAVKESVDTDPRKSKHK